MPDSEQNNPPASAAAKPMPKRYGIGLNVALQVLLALALFAGVNRLNYYHYWRWDLSPSQDYTLSSGTLAAILTSFVAPRMSRLLRLVAARAGDIHPA